MLSRRCCTHPCMMERAWGLHLIYADEKFVTDLLDVWFVFGNSEYRIARRKAGICGEREALRCAALRRGDPLR